MKRLHTIAGAALVMGLIAGVLSGQEKPVLLQPPLFAAIEKGDLEGLKAILAKDPALVGAKNPDGQSPLAYAARRGNLAAVETLLAAGVPVDQPGASGTPLLYAAGAGHLDVVKRLVDKGADIGAQSKVINRVGQAQVQDEGAVLLALEGWYTPDCLGQPQMDVVDYLVAKGAVLGVQEAAALGQVERLKALLTKDRKLVETRCQMDRTPLMWAAAFDQVEAAKVLLDAGAAIDAEGQMNTPLVDEWAKTPLYLAVEHRSYKVLDLLLTRGAHVNGTADASTTPLMLAIENGDRETVEKLLAHGADINAVPHNSFGDTALAVAYNKKHPELVDLLLEHKANPNAGEGTSEGTLLHAAVRQNDAAMVQRLIRAGASLNAADDDGLSALHRAAGMSGEDEIVRMLVAAGAGINATSKADWTPVHSAASAGEAGSLAVLLANGKADLNARDEMGWTPLDWAVWHRHEDIVQLLLAHGADANAVSREKLTPLLLAIYRESGPMAELLLKAGAKLDTVTAAGLGKTEALRALLAEDANRAYARETFVLASGDGPGKSALQWAAIGGHVDCLKLLLDAGTPVNTADGNGVTALHEAVLFGRTQAVELLLARGANANAQDRFANTPLAVAVDQRMPAMQEMLRKAGAKELRSGEILLAQVREKMATLAWDKLEELQKATVAANNLRDKAESAKQQTSGVSFETAEDRRFAALRKDHLFRSYDDDPTWAYARAPNVLTARRERELLAPTAIGELRFSELELDSFGLDEDMDPNQPNLNPFHLAAIAMADVMGDAQGQQELAQLANSANPLYAYHGMLMHLLQVWWLSAHDPATQADVLATMREIAQRLPANLKQRGVLSLTASRFLYEGAATPALMADVLKFIREDANDSSLARQETPDVESLMRRMELTNKPLTFTARTLDGATFSLDSLKGHVVVLDFWATWCGPCIAEMPKMEELNAKYGPQGLVVVGISSDEKEQALRDYLHEHPKMTWTQLFQPDSGNQHPLNARYGVEGIPTYFLLDRQGILRDFNGRDDLEKKVQRLLAQ